MLATPGVKPIAPVAYTVEFGDGRRQTNGSGAPVFKLSVPDERRLARIWNGDDYSVATAFIRGEFDIAGDIMAALRLRHRRSRGSWRASFLKAAARFAPARLETWFQTQKRARSNIRFHYDRSNEFYRKFLDSRLLYSSGYFEDPSWSLEQAQYAKLDLICRKLDIQPGERFLDVGCGWGCAGYPCCAALRRSGYRLHTQPHAVRIREFGHRGPRAGGSGRRPGDRLSKSVGPLQENRFGRHVRARWPAPSWWIFPEDPQLARRERVVPKLWHHPSPVGR